MTEKTIDDSQVVEFAKLHLLNVQAVAKYASVAEISRCIELTVQLSHDLLDLAIRSHQYNAYPIVVRQKE